MIFNKVYKMLNDGKIFMFVFNKENPGEAREIINYSDEAGVMLPCGEPIRSLDVDV